MLTEIRVSRADLIAERVPGLDADIHFCESLAAAVIREFTEVGETVLDPFAGYGTTLVVAERLGRRAVGIELLPERAAAIRLRIGADVKLHVGDVRDRLDDVAGGVRLCLTSPPYMTAGGHPENPLTGYRTDDGNYRSYLDDLAGIFDRIAALLDEHGHVVVNVADQGTPDDRTHLVADVTGALSRRLRLERIVPVVWDTSPDGIHNDTCVVFGKPSRDVPPAGSPAERR